jgi:hypothetical protein
MTSIFRYRTTNMRTGLRSATNNGRYRLLQEALNHPDVLGIGFYVVFVVFYFLVMDQP